MKYFFYTIVLVASLGAVGAMVNPALVQQCAALIGLELPKNPADAKDETSKEDRLALFMEQLYSPGNPQNDVAPSATVPTVVIQEPAPATPYLMPVMEPPPPVPVYANSIYANPLQSNSSFGNSWDSEIATPVYPQPTIDYQPAPQYSLDTADPFLHPNWNSNVLVASAPPQEVFAAAEPAIPFSLAQTNSLPPQPIQVPSSPPPNMSIQTPAVLIEEVPVHGTETIAKVGTQVILMGDILPKLRRLALKIVAENIKRMSEEERAKITQQEVELIINDIVTKLYPEMLQEQVLFYLVYNDYLFQQPKEQRAFFDEKFGEEFDRKEIPEMKKEFNVESTVDLKRFLEQQLGSSLEKEKRLWIQEQIARQWIGMSVQRGTENSTQDELLDFYEANKEMFTSAPKARWQEMTVLFSRHDTEQEAWNKIRWMGNQVASGVLFEEIAQAKSDGATALSGGVWDWTTKGSLTSAELEQAIFSQPIGQLSPAIIRSERGLHIVRVLERQEEKVVPFVEAQVTIREKIKNMRTQRQQDEYIFNLRQRYPTLVVRDRIDFDLSNTRTASSVR